MVILKLAIAEVVVVAIMAVAKVEIQVGAVALVTPATALQAVRRN